MNIARQVQQFIALSGMKPAQLARESGVHAVRISLLISGKQRDVMSAHADALRLAMINLDPRSAALALGIPLHVIAPHIWGPNDTGPEDTPAADEPQQEKSNAMD